MRDAFEVPIQVRYRDIDHMNHVNNAVYATYTEQARTEYFAEVVDADLTDLGVVIASLSIDFRRPITLDQDVVVALSVPRLGESSIPMDYEIRADGEVAATAETVMVAVDPSTRQSRPLPESWREPIASDQGL